VEFKVHGFFSASETLRSSFPVVLPMGTFWINTAVVLPTHIQDMELHPLPLTSRDCPRHLAHPEIVLKPLVNPADMLNGVNLAV